MGEAYDGATFRNESSYDLTPSGGSALIHQIGKLLEGIQDKHYPSGLIVPAEFLDILDEVGDLESAIAITQDMEPHFLGDLSFISQATLGVIQIEIVKI